ncbi:hypothetical protein [Candidatus Enterococcus mangumiae]|uniref:Uncharacterized protein n=1 Tax=Candidatus Enterococcus mangumiae TaxID=2230878 RepID=A0ABZ2SW15_9ENTE|nr:hypothetical protein [Enterococcus sp. DIV1094]MBO0488935.1 hypothetical protein [Enterococcus sp. DIV1094]
MLTDEIKILFFGQEDEYKRLFESNKFEQYQPGKDYQVQMFDACSNEIEQLIIRQVKEGNLLTLQNWEDFSDNLPMLLFPKNEKKLVYFSEYYDAMNRYPENRLSTVFRGAIQAGNLHTDGQKLFYINAEGNETPIDLRKDHGYKTALDMATDHKIRIIFSLTHLKQKNIEEKNYLFREDNGVLQESLRYVQEKWSRVENIYKKILFIENVRIVDPPWVKVASVKERQPDLDHGIINKKAEGELLKSDQTNKMEGEILLFGHKRACEEMAELPEVQEKLINKNYNDYKFDACSKAIENLIIEYVKEGKLITSEDLDDFSKRLPSLLEVQAGKLVHLPEYLRSMELKEGNHLATIFSNLSKDGNLKTNGSMLYHEYGRGRYCEKVPIKHLEIQAYDLAIETAIRGNASIYFSLDGTNMKGIRYKIQEHTFDTLNKKFYTNELFNSVLRKIYRNYTEIGGRVTFIEKGKQVAPPWLEGPFVGAWQEYIEHREKKLEQKLAQKKILRPGDKADRMGTLMRFIRTEYIIRTNKQNRKGISLAFQEKLNTFEQWANKLNEQKIQQPQKARSFSLHSEKRPEGSQELPKQLAAFHQWKGDLNQQGIVQQTRIFQEKIKMFDQLANTLNEQKKVQQIQVNQRKAFLQREI